MERKKYIDRTKDVLFLAPDWQRIGQRLFRLWHTASLYCHHV